MGGIIIILPKSFQLYFLSDVRISKCVLFSDAFWNCTLLPPVRAPGLGYRRALQRPPRGTGSWPQARQAEAGVGREGKAGVAHVDLAAPPCPPSSPGGRPGGPRRRQLLPAQAIAGR